MESDGHEVRVAHDRRQALAVAPAFEPQFIVMDVDLRSEASGQVVYRKLITASAKKPHIIAMTGAVNVDMAALREIGFDGHVAKPIDVKHVLTLLTG